MIQEWVYPVAKSTNIMLFAIVIMLFAIVIAFVSTGMGIVVFGVACIGVFTGVCGLAWDDRAATQASDDPAKPVAAREEQ